MRIILIVAVVAFAVSIFLGYGTYLTGSRTPRESARVVLAARVNGKPIPMYAVDDLYRQYISRVDPKIIAKLSDSDLKRIRREALQRIIRYELLYQEALKERLLVSKKDIDEEIRRIEKNFRTKEEFLDFLKRNHISIADLREELSKQMMVNKLMQKIRDSVKVTPEEVKQFYDNNPKLFIKPERVKVRFAVFKDKEAALKAEQNLKEGAEWKDITRGMEKEVLATSKDKVYTYAAYNLPPSVAKAVFSAELGALVGPVEVKGNKGEKLYYLVKVVGKLPSTKTSFADAKKRIEMFLKSQKALVAQSKFLDDLEKHAKVEILADELKPPKKSGKTTSKKVVKPTLTNVQKENKSKLNTKPAETRKSQ